MRSLACCSGRWKCGSEAAAARATRATISGVQSIGSSELMRNVTSPSIASSAQQRQRASDAASQVAAVRAEMHAGERDFLEAGRRDARDLARRVARSAGCATRRASIGMMQYAHCSSQPVCARIVNAVRPATPGSIDGAARAVAVAVGGRGLRRSRHAQRDQLLVVAHDAHDAGKRGDVRPSQRVA